jgi:membrane fusion protein, multidrug efflux system
VLCIVVAKPELTEHSGPLCRHDRSALRKHVWAFVCRGALCGAYYDVGAVVKQGDILANLDPTDQQNQLRAAQGDLAKVQAQLINARPTPAASKNCSTVASAPRRNSTPPRPT